jgi:hypothetical protein
VRADAAFASGANQQVGTLKALRLNEREADQRRRQLAGLVLHFEGPFIASVLKLNQDFHLARGDGQWHSALSPHFQALLDRLSDISLSLFLGLPLTDAAVHSATKAPSWS